MILAGAAIVKMSISGRLLFIATICVILHQVSADAESENEKEDASQENINSSEENKKSQEEKSDNKEEREERREDYWNPPPFEDLYCGHMNCYDLLGVTR